MALIDNSSPGEAWNVALGMREVREAGYADNLPAMAAQMRSALAGVETEWLVDRLSLMWDAMGHSKSDDVATAWLHETTRLLSDLPQDICSDAIDEAVKASERGFIPAIGEIRKYADPLLAKRKRAAARLNALVNFRAEKPAAVEQIDPADVSVILEQHGFGDVAAKLANKAKGPAPAPKMPTAEDYAAMGVPAQRMEAGTAETGGLGAQHDSLVDASQCALTPCNPSPSGDPQ